MRHIRRSWAGAGTAAALALALVLAACGSSSTSSDSGGGTAAAGAGGGKGGTLVVDNSFVNKTLDPGREFAPTDNMVVNATYDTLVTFKPGETKPVPWLAESWTVSKDARRFTFKLRTDAVFSDGKPVTSADVKFSFERLVNLKGNPAFLLDGVTVTTPEKHTVVLTTEKGNPALLRILGSPPTAVLNSKVVKAQGGSSGKDAAKTDKAERYLLTHSAGSGPYVLEQATQNQQITLKVNARFWGDKPHFDKVVIRNMPAPTQLLNVQRGSNEVAVDLSAQQAQSVKGKGALQVKTDASSNLFDLEVNMDPKVSPVTANPRIRNAIRHGLDYDAFVRLSGTGAVQATGLIPSVVLGSLPTADAPKRDVEKAKAEVAASGIKDPKITLSYPSDLNTNGVSFATTAQKAKASLAEIGIDVKLDGKAVAAFLASYSGGKNEMSVSYWSPDYPDPNDYLVYLPGHTGRAENANWKAGANPELEALGERAESTLDDAERGKLFQDIQRKLNEDSPYFPLFQPAQAIVASSNLTNVVLSPVYVLDVRAVGSK